MYKAPTTAKALAKDMASVLNRFRESILEMPEHEQSKYFAKMDIEFAEKQIEAESYLRDRETNDTHGDTSNLYYD